MIQLRCTRLRQTAVLVTALLPGLQAAHAAPVPTTLAGDWTSGYISPIEYYDPASGKWVDASGTSSILLTCSHRIGPDENGESGILKGYTP